MFRTVSLVFGTVYMHPKCNKSIIHRLCLSKQLFCTESSVLNNLPRLFTLGTLGHEGTTTQHKETTEKRQVSCCKLYGPNIVFGPMLLLQIVPHTHMIGVIHEAIVSYFNQNRWWP